MTAVLVIFGAMIGAPLRYLADLGIQRQHNSLFPWGTFTVNGVGSLVLGGLAGAGTALPDTAMALIGTGFCGALTTYSTFSYETLRLVEEHAYLYAILNVVTSVVITVGAAFLGYATIHALT